MYRSLTFLCLALFSSVSCFAQNGHSEERQNSKGNSPFEFVQRTDVRNELNVSDQQVSAIETIAPGCDALCQQKLQEMTSDLDLSIISQFQDLASDEQASALQSIQNDVRESVEFEMLDEWVLDDPQMDRFEQLWTQNAGINGLTSGRIGNQLNLSPSQFTQIENVINAGSAVMSACKSSGQSTLQQNIQINIIQNNMIDLCVACLTDEQIGQYLEMYGESFEFDSEVDSEFGTVDSDIENESLAADTEAPAVETQDLADVDVEAIAGAPSQTTSSPVNRNTQTFGTQRSGSTQVTPGFKNVTRAKPTGQQNPPATTIKSEPKQKQYP